jgi:four helix bundle protein
VFNFQNLGTWQKAMDFAEAVYGFTTSFPSDERCGLTNQMRRAAVSISSTFAESSSRKSKVDYARFAEIATGSLCELVSQSYVAQRRGMLADPNFTQIYSAAEELSRLRACLVGNSSGN